MEFDEPRARGVDRKRLNTSRGDIPSVQAIDSQSNNVHFISALDLALISGRNSTFEGLYANELESETIII